MTEYTQKEIELFALGGVIERLLTGKGKWRNPKFVAFVLKGMGYSMDELAPLAKASSAWLKQFPRQDD